MSEKATHAKEIDLKCIRTPSADGVCGSFYLQAKNQSDLGLTALALVALFGVFGNTLR